MYSQICVLIAKFDTFPFYHHVLSIMQIRPNLNIVTIIRVTNCSFSNLKQIGSDLDITPIYQLFDFVVLMLQATYFSLDPYAILWGTLPDIGSFKSEVTLRICAPVIKHFLLYSRIALYWLSTRSDFWGI